MANKILRIVLIIVLFVVFFELGLFSSYTIVTAEAPDPHALIDMQVSKITGFFSPEKVNEALDGTPFKIAYRTRNEFLVYAVIRGAENLTAALDEMTSMKILSRIEGDSERTKTPLEALEKIVNEHINTPDDGKEKAKSISAAKIAEMLKKLESSGYTSFWS